MNEKHTRRKLSAILSADAEGYSRLMADDEQATVRTITSYREFMISIIQAQNGRVVDAKGDNILAEFASAVDAVQCAVEIQQGLKKRNSELPDHRKMEFRIGINLGDIIEEKGTIYGDGVNIAARLEGLAHPGGICISGTTCDQVKNKLDLGYEYLGEQTVKNIPEPVRVYRVLVDPEAAGKVIGERRFLGKISRRTAIAAIIILIVVAGGLTGWNYYLRQYKRVEPASLDRMAFPLPDKPSIAVLPFDNLTGDPGQEFFSDGLTEEIITALSKIPRLFVVARNSTFTYKSKPAKVQQISEELGVRYVVEGSVRRDEDRVRITAQLIDALSGHHIWAERYDRHVKDIFTVQDEITMKIITAVQVKLTEGEQASISARGTENLEAYLKASEAQWLLRQSTKEGTLKAKQLAEEAIALDPNYAYAYAALGMFHGVSLWLGISKSPGESLKSAIEQTQKAITLKNSFALAYVGLGYWLTMAKKYDKAIASAERAMALQPNSAEVIHNYAAILSFAGRRKEAIPLFREALRLNPIPPNSYYRQFAMTLREAGQYEEAIAMMKRAIEREPNDHLAHLGMVVNYTYAGRMEEARAAAKEVVRIMPNFSADRFGKVMPNKDPVVTRRIVEALKKAGLK
ncbi:MAG: adenylate/guanylate cyclase domain-containing protein [Planctomycetota bacterium]